MKKLLPIFLFLLLGIVSFSGVSPNKPIRILIVTGGHNYDVEQFNKMLASLGKNISFQIAELPAAYEAFLPENRSKYDVLVFYHMWQKITVEQAEILSDCIKQGKPLVALHHSICAYDDWPEYINLIGGKYFHKPTTLNGKEFAACSYKHDLHYKIKIADIKHPVTKGIDDFEIFDETYNGYYVETNAKPLLVTDEPTSSPIVGWTKQYGKARVVTLQSGHDAPTFENPNYRKLLKQSIEWVYQGIR